MLKLSFPSKMPCASFGLPAMTACVTGGKLTKLKGSVCNQCYAVRGNYSFKGTVQLREENLRLTRLALEGSGSEWIETIEHMIKASGMGYFRWHDSGDLLSSRHLWMIVEVANRCKGVRFWLPTREYGFVTEYTLDGGKIPKNLTVRLSAHMIGQTIDTASPFVSSSVGSGKGRLCPATYDKDNEGRCGSCRACWTRSTVNIDYKKH